MSTMSYYSTLAYTQQLVPPAALHYRQALALCLQHRSGAQSEHTAPGVGQGEAAYTAVARARPAPGVSQ